MMYTLSWNLRPAFVSKKTGLLATLRAGRAEGGFTELVAWRVADQPWNDFTGSELVPADVNLAATVPGWNCWGPAEDMLRRIRPEASSAQAGGTEFAAFLTTTGSSTANLNAEQREKLFRDFQQWQERQRSSRQR